MGHYFDFFTAIGAATSTISVFSFCLRSAENMELAILWATRRTNNPGDLRKDIIGNGLGFYFSK
jgi:hypothetical protein